MRRVEESNRRNVRWVYLQQAWPEGDTYASPTEAILAAPADAVIDALNTEIDTLRGVLNDERVRHHQTAHELAELRAALRTVQAAFPAELFEAAK